MNSARERESRRLGLGMHVPEGRATLGFTLIELLVVIAVLGVLIAMITALATRATESQKIANTKNLMRTVEFAIDQFSTNDPLRLIYNNPRRLNGRTFGALPPYELRLPAQNPNHVTYVLEPNYDETHSPGNSPPTLSGRLWHNLGNGVNQESDWVQIEKNDPMNDDIRALSAYLAVFEPSGYAGIPSRSLKPLPVKSNLPFGEVVNASGKLNTLTPGNLSATEGTKQVLGIYDAFDVPLDYFIALRIEWRINPSTLTPGWVVMDRIPVLRSRGVDREVYDASQGKTSGRRAIYSRALPAPLAEVDKDGYLKLGKTQSGGWVRAVAGDGNKTYDGYGYRPEFDDP